MPIFVAYLALTFTHNLSLGLGLSLSLGLSLILGFVLVSFGQSGPRIRRTDSPPLQASQLMLKPNQLISKISMKGEAGSPACLIGCLPCFVPANSA